MEQLHLYKVYLFTPPKKGFLTIIKKHNIVDVKKKYKVTLSINLTKG